MTALLLGATGFLGRYLAERLSRTLATSAPRPRSGDAPCLGGVKWLDARFEASDETTIDRVLDEARPDVIVNAIGIMPSAAGDTQLLDRVNGEFPHRLASCAGARGARVVHISTDGVFSGARGTYVETDTPDATDAYGRSKLAGEIGAPHLTIRTSFFGRTPRGSGVIEWLVTQRGRTIEGFVDYRFTGIAAAVLADLVTVAVARDTALEGVYHVGGEAFSKYDLLKAAAERLQIDVQVVPVSRGPVDRTLDSTRFFTAIGRRSPALADSLARLTPCGALSHS